MFDLREWYQSLASSQHVLEKVKAAITKRWQVVLALVAQNREQVFLGVNLVLDLARVDS